MSVSRRRSPVGDRAQLDAAHRVVVKVGSSSLTSISGGIDEGALSALVDVLAAQRATGKEVILVTSGAIAAGLAPLGLATRPKDLASQQAAAGVGQGLLMARYNRAFSAYDIRIGQVLLTADDLIRRQHYQNAHRSLNRLLDLGVLPIVNENDAVATHEIRFGDNDRLAALVAHLAHADLLLLLSDVDSLYDGPPSAGAQRIAEVRGLEDLAGVTIGSSGKAGVGTGGMATKVDAATMAAANGVPALVTSADNAGPALNGDDVGTWFHMTGSRRPVRLMWLAHLASVRGRLHLDDGAVRAVREARRSLLPAGITSVDGDFSTGDPVELLDPAGVVIARGIVNFDSDELPEMLGRSTRELAESLGHGFDREVVHVNDLVLARVQPVTTAS